MSGGWLQRVRPAPWTEPDGGAPDRIVLWPHAGGAPAAFSGLAAELPGFEVCGVVPPGRGVRFDEPAVTDPDRAVAGALAAVDALPPVPGRLVVLGHSLGAAMAARLAARLGERCDLLVVSGWPGPGRVPRSPVGGPAERMGPDELLEFLDRIDAPGRAELRDPDVAEFLLPPLLADLRMGDVVAGAPAARPRAPMVTVAGRSDPAFAVADIAQWSEACNVVEAVLLDGGHFAVLSDCVPVAAAVRRALGRVGSGAGEPR